MFNLTSTSAKSIGLLGNGKDESAIFQKYIDAHSSINITFSPGTIYLFRNIVIKDKSNVTLTCSSGSTNFYLADDDYSESIISIINCTNVTINRINFNGNEGTLTNYAVQIIAQKSNSIKFQNCTICNVDSGGLLISNATKVYSLVRNQTASKSIVVSSCQVQNYGTKSAIQIRGSHQNVLVDNCFTSDPFGKQTEGAHFGFSAEVTYPDQIIGKLIVRNCNSRYSNRASFFFQKVKNLLVENIEIVEAGKNQLNIPSTLSAIKCDDLCNESAVIRNVSIRDSAQFSTITGIALEQDKGVTQNVRLENIQSDSILRIGGGGSNKINICNLTARMQLSSSNNVVSNAYFILPKFGSAIVVAGNSNSIRNSQFTNCSIEIQPKVVDTKIENSELLSTTGKHFVAVSLNDPNSPNTLSVIKCKCPIAINPVFSGGNEAASKGIVIWYKDNNFDFSERLKREATLIKLK